MKAGIIDGVRQVRVGEWQRPKAEAGEVVIRVGAAGVCGTDAHILAGEYEMARFPLIAGHEFAGEVAEVGEGVSGFAVGDAVTADPNIPCNACEFCARNQPNHCQNLSIVGVTRPGAFAEYVAVPASVTFQLGDISVEEGALVEPLACVVWGLERVRVSPGDRVLIFGAGPMGMLLLQAILAAGASSVDVVDLSEKRLELAANLGAARTFMAGDPSRSSSQGSAAAPAERAYDLVVDATGAVSVIEGCFAHARPAGKVWLFGVAPSDACARFSPYQVFRNDLTIFGSFALNRTFAPAIALASSGRVKLSPLVSHKLPLSDFSRGFKLAGTPEAMKVQFVL